MKVVIEIRGGMVSAVYADEPENLDLHVYDYDGSADQPGQCIESEFVVRQLLDARFPDPAYTAGYAYAAGYPE